MNHEERLEKIMRMVETRQSVSIQELRSKLYVSDATIRRDLTELSHRGMIIKSHGGAIAATKVSSIIVTQNAIPATPIAEAAAKLIEDNSVIFLSGGAHTNAMMSGVVRHSGLTVVTDSSIIASALCDVVDHLYCTGGKYIPSNKVFGGSMAAEFAADLRYDQAFFSCYGISSDHSITYATGDRVLLLRTVSRLSRQRIFLCDRADFQRVGRVNTFQLNDMDTIVTDAPDLISDHFRHLVIPV